MDSRGEHRQPMGRVVSGRDLGAVMVWRRDAKGGVLEHPNALRKQHLTGIFKRAALGPDKCRAGLRESDKVRTRRNPSVRPVFKNTSRDDGRTTSPPMWQRATRDRLSRPRLPFQRAVTAHHRGRKQSVLTCRVGLTEARAASLRCVHAATPARPRAPEISRRRD